MILQKPKVKKSVPNSISRPYQASFLPENKMSDELEAAFNQNNEFKQLMSIPDKIIGNYINKKTNHFKINSRFKEKAAAATTTMCNTRQ
jgi:hypothetical protein